MDKGNYTLKDMLKAGMSVEEIQADFNKQIEAAQAELAKDENNSKKMQAPSINLARACIFLLLF